MDASVWFSFSIFTFLGLSAQETIESSIMHDDLVREYTLYVPASYTGDEAVPLIFNFHGFGSNAFEQMWYGDFRAIADTAGFLLVHPQGTELDGVTHWNVGGWTVGSTIDDVGFTEALIDSLAANYNINPNRIYSTGMSNGGYMSMLLACQLSDRIAAIASVTGSMTPETMSACSPTHPTPVMQIHGTADGTVPYEGAIWTESINNVLSYWTEFNSCFSNPVISAVEDINTSDGCTAEHYVYPYGDDGTSVEHFKITNGQHTWPGTFFTSAGTNLDINASKEIWKFFSRYDIDGSIAPVSITDLTAQPELNVFPNPANKQFTVENLGAGTSDYSLYSALGKLVQSGTLRSNSATLNVNGLPENIYFLHIKGEVIKLIVQH